ncbi:hypothetical protein HanOQP8_Chr16g0607011 [Helianthus annuus]|nr:hypothetical protein HanOQP8_Chr16g0607011 [Helianthus annuus]
MGSMPRNVIISCILIVIRSCVPLTVSKKKKKNPLVLRLTRLGACLQYDTKHTTTPNWNETKITNSILCIFKLLMRKTILIKERIKRLR